MREQFGDDLATWINKLKSLWYEVKEPVPGSTGSTGSTGTPTLDPWLYVAAGGLVAVALTLFKRQKK